LRVTDRLPEPSALPLQPMAAERASASPLYALAPAASLEQPLEALPGPQSTALPDLQAWLLAAICGSRPVDASLVVSAGPKLSARERLEIYHYGYRARLSECLRDDYPALAATLGEARFAALCAAYIEHYPSASPSLNAFGRHMSAHCARALLAEHGAFLSELARLEWALVEVVHAAIPAPLDLGALQTLPPDAWNGVRLLQSEAVRLLQFEHPTNAYYQAFRGEGRLGAYPLRQASACAVYRIGPTLWRMDLTPAMARLLSALFSGATIGAALRQISVDEHDPAALAEAERGVMTWFSAWVRCGFFAGADA
jgi:hypothetical protein